MDIYLDVSSTSACAILTWVSVSALMASLTLFLASARNSFMVQVYSFVIFFLGLVALPFNTACSFSVIFVKRR